MATPAPPLDTGMAVPAQAAVAPQRPRSASFSGTPSDEAISRTGQVAERSIELGLRPVDPESVKRYQGAKFSLNVNGRAKVVDFAARYNGVAGSLRKPTIQLLSGQTRLLLQAVSNFHNDRRAGSEESANKSLALENMTDYSVSIEGDLLVVDIITESPHENFKHTFKMGDDIAGDAATAEFRVLEHARELNAAIQEVINTNPPLGKSTFNKASGYDYLQLLIKHHGTLPSTVKSREEREAPMDTATHVAQDVAFRENRYERGLEAFERGVGFSS